MERRASVSSLKFDGYIVNKVIFERNENTDNNIKEWNLTFDVNNKTEINKENNKMRITLKLEIFKDIDNAPFIMEIEVMGIFSLEGESDIKKYEANAIAIMYPYLRAIVSTYTASANVAPVILPAINVNAMLRRKNEENKEN